MTRATPEQVADERKHSRANMIQPAERAAAELARIADTLECIRLELVALVDKEQSCRT